MHYLQNLRANFLKELLDKIVEEFQDEFSVLAKKLSVYLVHGIIPEVFPNDNPG